jgi:hypothetical protein
MNEQPILKNELSAGLPPLWPDSLLQQSRARIGAQGQRPVVLHTFAFQRPAGSLPGIRPGVRTALGRLRFRIHW